jgi:hypothetical protein
MSAIDILRTFATEKCFSFFKDPRLIEELIDYLEMKNHSRQ